MADDLRIEKIAALIHKEWVEWSMSLTATETLNPERLLRWQRCWVSYKNLPEETKEQDRVWARKVLAICDE